MNSEVAVTDPKKAGPVYRPQATSDSPMEDYQTVHPGILAQPEFPFLPAGLKIARVEEYNRLKRELEKARETKQML